ncbi:MAG: tRNA (adenosine(37)-N6)-threonylcarbamoyltransferase complex dimerization subunit type 1 TsaB [Aridibacter famidurans]|nr:tRNA (adenosine(37)-N6)-threonylcarbamoyltransferase complex dimerization subunit type 1 TsaB [Aridibacter famidurans]
MHITLAIDTCLGAGSAALFADGEEVRALDELSSSKQDAPQIHAVNEMLASEGLRIDSPDEMIVTRGPGSFTGVRTGISILRGLLRARRFSYSTCTVMEALTAAVPDDFGHCRTAIYAGKREVAIQDFKREGNHFKMKGGHLLVEKDLLLRTDGQFLVLGPGLAPWAGPDGEFGGGEGIIRSDRNVARLAFRYVKSLAEEEVSQTLEPLYTRDFVAGRS